MKLLSILLSFFWTLYTLASLFFLNSGLNLFFLSGHTSVFCSSLLDLRILISCGQGKNAFWRIFLIITFLFMVRNFRLQLSQLPCSLANKKSSGDIFIYSYRVEKLKVTALSRVWKFWGFQLSEFSLIMTNGIRKVRQGVDIFDKKILNSCTFI